MNAPKRHHYVPQFHLRRFLDGEGKLWVWDKIEDRIFATVPSRIAVETNFYFLSEFAEQSHDPLTMERQFSDLEHQASVITSQWLDWLREIESGAQIDIPTVNREIVSLHIALQFLRTADSRDLLGALAEVAGQHSSMSEKDQRRLHTTTLWDERVFKPMADWVRQSIWIFARNSTSTPFLTSDNPVTLRTADNAMWVKVGFLSNGAYVVYPLAPDIVMYCYPRKAPWENLAKFDGCLSPVDFNNEMAESENSGQVFMASRFVISQTKEFASAREFSATIGTDRYSGD